MTEEIIINGVNVAGCEFYFQDEKYSCNLSFINQEELCKCDDVQDCTYKQLKRLEQENKELKEFCIELEKQKERQHNQWFERCTENHNEDSKIIEKYRSALEEIREIAKFNQFYNPEDLLINGGIGQIQDLKMTEIYNKINEVLQ